MKRTTAWALGIAVYLLVNCVCAAADPADAPKHVGGTLLRIDQNSLTLSPVGPPGKLAPEQTFTIAMGTKVLRGDIDVGGVRQLPATVAELRPGARITVAFEKEIAAEVRILPPPPVVGTVLAADGHSIVVRSVLTPGLRMTADNTFVVNSQRTQVSQMRVRYGPTRRVDLSSIKPGQSVMVLAKDHFAFVVTITPAVPVIGVLQRATETTVAIKPTTRPGAPAAAERSFPIDRARTEVFNEYFGAPVELAGWSELEAGKSVAVTVEDGFAAAITMLHPAFYGKLAAIGADWISVIPSGPATNALAQRKFTFDVHSEIDLGQELGTRKLPSGKTQHLWHYLPGAKLSDLNVGESVSVTAKGDIVLSMRVTPVTTTGVGH